MLDHYLERAVEKLRVLAELTRKDIEDIKAANHEGMFERIRTKEHTLVAFENLKALIDNEIASIARKHPDSELEELLDDSTREKLAQMREELEELQKLNRYYARFVITVSEFYNALFEEMLPVEKDGYTGKSAKAAALIEVRA